MVVYDICDEKRLRKISKILEKEGIRVQNSTFEIDNTLNDVNISKLFDTLREICETRDKVFIYKIKLKKDIQETTDVWEMIFWMW